MVDGTAVVGRPDEMNCRTAICAVASCIATRSARQPTDLPHDNIREVEMQHDQLRRRVVRCLSSCAPNEQRKLIAHYQHGDLQHRHNAKVHGILCC